MSRRRAELLSKRFEIWWSGFERRTRHDDPFDAALRLSVKLRRTRVADRPEFVNQLWEVLLQRRHAYGVALFFLDSLTDAQYLRSMAEYLVPLPPHQPHDEESHLADLVRILAAADMPGVLAPVEEYLLDRAIGPLWATVPWALWPHQTELFALAWLRYLREIQPNDWSTAMIIKSFLTEPDAVRLVRTTISQNHPEHWNSLREALLGEAEQVGWLSDEQRESLGRAVL